MSYGPHVLLNIVVLINMYYTHNNSYNFYIK